ncbi:hypothetical protein NA57DRAFT_73541 [Rhizodiscina lignyota]|uniref:Heterokaryon incompatibility domain-containing protein n=1 Tax=Rhizodiscina lignyota TaxID=1504668 RepID=A0A9P4IMT4_9PEZI|nr:hypothetical protein NA57DRAFT_73541 [Rhizodiscina lignyota]
MSWNLFGRPSIGSSNESSSDRPRIRSYYTTTRTIADETERETQYAQDRDGLEAVSVHLSSTVSSSVSQQTRSHRYSSESALSPTTTDSRTTLRSPTDLFALSPGTSPRQSVSSETALSDTQTHQETINENEAGDRNKIIGLFVKWNIGDAKNLLVEISNGTVTFSKRTFKDLKDVPRHLGMSSKKRLWCPFCELLCESLSIEDDDLCKNKDPLRVDEVRNHLPPKLQGVNFRDWLSKRGLMSRLREHFEHETVWPFGISADKKDRTFDPDAHGTAVGERPEEDIDTPEQISDGHLEQGADIAALSATAGLRAGLVSEASLQDRAILEAVDSSITAGMLAKAQSRRPPPCILDIRLHSGLITVALTGHSRKPRSTLMLFSKFNLRIASDLVQDDGKNLHYGKLLTLEIDFSLITQAGSRSSVEFRLIDVEDECLVKSNNRPRNFEYVALSYVWGKYSHRSCVQLKIQTEGQFMALGGLSSSRISLPTTIRDAIRVVKEAGMRYLFVDRLCINAQFTIVAADGEGADAGLFRTRCDPRQIAREILPNINVLLPIAPKEKLIPWDGRAWTLQEKLLSRRLLVFSRGFMTWHCRATVAYEDMTAKDSAMNEEHLHGSPLFQSLLPETVVPKKFRFDYCVRVDSNGRAHMERPIAFKKYVDLIEDYTKRDMTKNDDALNALGGVLPSFNRAFGCSSHFGLPQAILDVALLWQPVGILDRRKISKGEAPFPSWSWASWIGAVRYEQTFEVRTDWQSARLVKLIHPAATMDQQERMRPMLRWYAVKRKPAVPEKPNSLSVRAGSLNSQGRPPVPRKKFTAASSIIEIGLLASQGDKQRSGAPTSRGDQLWGPRDLPGTVLHWEASRSTFHKGLTHSWELPQVNQQYLVFRTQRAAFTLGKPIQRIEQHQIRSNLETPPETVEVKFDETEIVDERRKVIGKVKLHAGHDVDGARKDFIIISETEYFGDEARVDVGDYPLYNVMLVEKHQDQQKI